MSSEMDRIQQVRQLKMEAAAAGRMAEAAEYDRQEQQLRQQAATCPKGGQHEWQPGRELGQAAYCPKCGQARY